ncbi:hypothetical protein B0H14DRAFT_3493568 [Mycena olivaceomarginata]|nr:hypothetical protein B0H14DRAFT_3493568 [Mycena olivaceomarginata]
MSLEGSQSLAACVGIHCASCYTWASRFQRHSPRAPPATVRPSALTAPKITPRPSAPPVVLHTLLHHAVCMRYPPPAPPCRCSMSRPAARCPGSRRWVAHFARPRPARGVSQGFEMFPVAPPMYCARAPSAVAPTLRTLSRHVPVIPPPCAVRQPRRISGLREVPWDALYAPRTHSPPAAVYTDRADAAPPPPHPRRASRTCAAPLGWPISVPYSNRFFGMLPRRRACARWLLLLRRPAPAAHCVPMHALYTLSRYSGDQHRPIGKRHV